MKNRIDFLLLNILKAENAINKTLAITIKEMPLEDINCSIRHIQSRIKELKNIGLILEGLKDGNSKTYYLSEAGLKALE